MLARFQFIDHNWMEWKSVSLICLFRFYFIFNIIFMNDEQIFNTFAPIWISILFNWIWIQFNQTWVQLLFLIISLSSVVSSNAFLLTRMGRLYACVHFFFGFLLVVPHSFDCALSYTFISFLITTLLHP